MLVPSSRLSAVTLLGGILALLLALGSPIAGAASFTTFESGQVRPLAMSPDGSRLFVTNTPDNRLEIFAVSAAGLTHTGSVPVGLEPVAVAARTNGEVWVVNHLSDSVSVVDVAASPPHVVRTLLVGDEPRDVVFAGPGGTRAFITTAHRGQQRTDSSLAAVPGAGDPQLTTAGVGRADIWVFDTASLGADFGGDPITILSLFGDTPRALAVAPGGATVYAAVFHSGNQTTALNEGAVCNGGQNATCNVGGLPMPGGLPVPNTNFLGDPQPETGLIIKFNGATGHWEDRLGRDWTNGVRFSLPDLDVFAISAGSGTTLPAQTGSFAHVGTILFNMAVNPVSGKVYVSNTDARNEVRFEGPGTFAGSSVRGHLAESRITVLDGTNVLPRHLNKHLDYDVVPSDPTDKAKSLATPVGMAITSNGQTLYVAAFGSSAIGIFSTAELENNTFAPDAADHIEVSGGGPSGLALDEAHHRLYVLTRFDNGISIINTATAEEDSHLSLFDREPAIVKDGRPVLYDAVLTSSNGEAACASCHIFGDFDSLAWDLGNPDDVTLNQPNPFRVPNQFNISFQNFAPLKGPMTTQSLRGMANHGPMHWRGDRTAGNDVGGDPLDEHAAFKKFIIAFDGLLGRGAPISDDDMERFTDFILQVTYPPNPIRKLDNSLTDDQQAGHDKFFSAQNSDVFQNCDGCHDLDAASGFFGSDGFSSFEFETQLFKIPHLRNAYQKVGMFGIAPVAFLNPGDNGDKGAQIRGFGFLHDGSVDTLFRFHNATVFNRTNPAGFPLQNPGGFPTGATGDLQRRQVEQFVLAFDSNLAPIVGQQITLAQGSAPEVGDRIDLLIARAGQGECDLVAKWVKDGQQRGALLVSGAFQTDLGSEVMSDNQLRASAATPGQEVTYTCVPPGSGMRIGIDRDEDGFLDQDEVLGGSDPADPVSIPGLTRIQTTSLSLKDDSTPPADPEKRKVSFKSSTKKDPATNQVTPPALGSAGDPTLHGATLTVYNAAGQTTDEVTVPLPAGPEWTAIGSGGFKWKSKTGPITVVLIKQGKLQVKGGKSGWGYSLDEMRQEEVAVRLALADGRGWCASAPAKESGNPPSTDKNDHRDKFQSQKKAPPPATCPTPPSGSPSGAFVSDE